MMRTLLVLLFLALTACGGGQAVAPVGTYSKQAKKINKTVKPPTIISLKKGIPYFQ